jgi:excisionase family DNA binding protein
VRSKWIKASEAAELLGVSPSTITKMVKRGELTARSDPRDKRVTLIDRDQVEALLAEIREVHGNEEREKAKE